MKYSHIREYLYKEFIDQHQYISNYEMLSWAGPSISINKDMLYNDFKKFIETEEIKKYLNTITINCNIDYSTIQLLNEIAGKTCSETLSQSEINNIIKELIEMNKCYMSYKNKYLHNNDGKYNSFAKTLDDKQLQTLFNMIFVPQIRGSEKLEGQLTLIKADLTGRKIGGKL